MRCSSEGEGGAAAPDGSVLCESIGDGTRSGMVTCIVLRSALSLSVMPRVGEKFPEGHGAGIDCVIPAATGFLEFSGIPTFRPNSRSGAKGLCIRWNFRERIGVSMVYDKNGACESGAGA